MRSRILLAALACSAIATPALAQLELAQNSGCTACHTVDKKLVGPAYKEVSAKYKGNAKAQAMLEEKVKKGGVGVWGQVPMPPNSQVTDADVKKLVAWILSL
jgi:cytochrome c